MTSNYSGPDDDRRKHRRTVDFTFNFDPKSIRVDATPFGLVVDLPDGRHDGTPGGPALPVITFEAALPPGTVAANVTFETGQSVSIAEGTPVAPLQRAAPGVRVCSHFDRLRDDGLVLPWPKPDLIPPDPELYKQAIALGRQTATITNIDVSGLQPIVAVMLRPLVLSERGELILHTTIRVALELVDRDAHADDPGADAVRFSSHAQASRWVELSRSRVLNPADVIDVGGIIGHLISRAEYLIITDNQRWDAQTIRPIGPAGGDLEAEFERLAAWKRTKGLSARVVTISEIVNGHFGSFTGWCRRDLQEVLREFIKFAHANWGTAWLLLGGDIDIIPARDVVGYVGGFSPAPKDPPDPGTSFWTGTFLKIRADVSSDTPLLRTSSGRRIPYDAAGSSSTTQLGWYFTDASYTTRSTMPTGFVRVNGPAAQINTELFWLTGDNTIPTDLYYADVAGYPERSANGHLLRLAEPSNLAVSDLSASAFSAIDVFTRFCGGHDWDDVGNSLYGQWNSNGDLDGVHYRADISVGRAPVGSATEAKTFVDKVLRYEGAATWFLSTSWLRKLLVVSANWGGRSDYGPANPLVDNSYIKRPSDDHATIQLSAAPSSFNFKLITVVTEADQRELPFRLDASSSIRGWRFAQSATNPAASFVSISLPWGGTIPFPIPSRWIVAYGTAQEMAPQRFILDESAADGSMLDQEALRTQLAADVPGWSSVRRLYEDEVDLPPPAVGATPLEHLTGAGITARLNEGQHIVSLSGHGWWGGCCGLEPSMKTSLNNGGATFIAYADSCLTNQFDVDDAISEGLVQNDHGGAVAYVGNTRFSWIGVGDDFQRNFFKGLPATRALGVLNDRRLAMVNANTGFWPVYNRWSIFSLNLIGDPEMRVWTRAPRRLCLEVVEGIRLDHRLPVLVKIDDRPAAGVVVTLQQEGFIRQARSDHSGYVHFDIDGAKTGALSIVAFDGGAAPVTTTIAVSGPVWIEGSVRSIRSEGNDVIAVIHAAEGERMLTVAAAAAALTALLAQAHACARRVRVRVGDGDSIEAVELVDTRTADGDQTR